MASTYYNSYTQKHSAANLAYGAGQPWNWTPNYPPNHQFLSDMETPPHHPHQMYYNPHHMFHSAVAANVGTDWHSPASTAGADNYAQNMPATAHQLLPPHHVHSLGGSGSGAGGGGGIGGSGLISGGGGGGGVGGSGLISGGSTSSSSSASSGPASGNNSHLSENNTNTRLGEHQQQQQQHIAEGLPSPPITVSGSELSSPGAPASSSSPHLSAAHSLNNSASSSIGTNSSHNTSSGTMSNNTMAHNSSSSSSPTKQHQYYDWMKKPAYPAQPQPGKTRTKDKYRVVYTDFQRLELEKEYCTSRYITIRRKTELAQSLSLSERQVKIWFQNRRAKERKQSKKSGEPTGMTAVHHPDYMLDAKTKLEPGLHLQHPLHTMNPMAAMGMPMRLPAHLAAHSHSLAAAAAHSHQMQHHNAQMSAAAAAAGVGALSM